MHCLQFCIAYRLSTRSCSAQMNHTFVVCAVAINTHSTEQQDVYESDGSLVLSTEDADASFDLLEKLSFISAVGLLLWLLLLLNITRYRLKIWLGFIYFQPGNRFIQSCPFVCRFVSLCVCVPACVHVE